MAAVATVDVDGPAAVKERLEAFAGRGAGGGDEPAGAGGQRRAVCARAGRAGAAQVACSRLVVSAGGAPAEYESMQQFLADSPWDPAAGRARVRGAGGARDRGGGLGAGRHRVPQGREALAGGEAPVLGHAGQDRQLPDRRSRCTRSAQRGRCRWAGRCICPRSGARTPSGGARRRSRTRSCFQTKPELGCRSWSSGRPAGRFPRRRCSATRLRRQHGAARAPRTRPGCEYVLAVCGRDRRCSRPRRSSPCPSEQRRAAGRPKSRPRPTASPRRSATLIARLRRRARADGHLPRRPRRRADDLAVRLRARPRRARLARRRTPSPPREEWLIAEWPAGARGSRPTTGSPTSRRHRARAARPARPAALEDRARLQASSRASSASTTTKAAPGSAGTTTPRSSPPPTPSSPSSACTRKPRGRPDTPADGAAPAARPPVLGRPLPNLPPTRRPRPAPAPLPRQDE